MLTQAKLKVYVRYEDKVAAARVYDEAALRYFGEFAKPNEHFGRYR
jgi:hypothetical protein